MAFIERSAVALISPRSGNRLYMFDAFLRIACLYLLLRLSISDFPLRLVDCLSRSSWRTLSETVRSLLHRGTPLIVDKQTSVCEVPYVP